MRFVKGTAIEKPPNIEGDGVMAMLKHPINVMLIFLPFGVCAYFREWGELYCFWLNFFAMVPLAKILGDATEELAAGLKNDILAGLLNATFGNAVEMVITVQTLRAGLFAVVKATLLGSVLSNTLLVLGMSFLCGGIWTIKEKRQNNVAPGGVAYEQLSSRDPPVAGLDGVGKLSDNSEDVVQTPQKGASLKDAMQDFGIEGEKIQSFSVLGALVNTSMLLISCMSFSLITVFHTVVSDSHEDEGYIENILLPLSRISSIIIMLAYIAYIVFQLFTHKEAMTEEEGDEGGEDDNSIPVWVSAVILCFSTVLTACSSEILVQAIEGVTEKAHLSQHFIGIILLPIVGNACEHAAAVRFAVQDKLGLSVSIAVGSSTQIALFVVPFAVLIGWAFDRDMDLNFGMLNTSMITLSVVVVLSMVVDGQSNWLQGYLLCSVYCIIAVMYSYLPDD